MVARSFSKFGPYKVRLSVDIPSNEASMRHRPIGPDQSLPVLKMYLTRRASNCFFRAARSFSGTSVVSSSGTACSSTFQLQDALDNSVQYETAILTGLLG